MFTSILQKTGQRQAPLNSDVYKPIASTRVGRRMRRAQRANGGNLLAA